MSKQIKVSLIGNPNTGKTSVFNLLTGLNQQVGNYPGITVDKKSGFLKLSDNRQVSILDLPGTYSIYPRSEDERVVYNLLHDPIHPDFPDLIVVIVDAANLEFPQFAEMLMETTGRHKINTNGIVIELIESHLPDDETWLLEVIARLSMAGFEIAMDDFSTGASSFDLLKAGAFAEIKLDVALVQNSADDLASAKFITSTLEIAKDLGTRVIAEGVETADDLIRMKNMGVECIQGFLIARPLDRSNLKTNYGSSAEEARVAS